MTSEEKAKRFDKALEQLKGLIEGTREDKCAIVEEDIINIFPELRETKDEKIIKAIIAHIKDLRFYDTYYGVTPDEMVAWLERQEQVKKTAIPQHENKTCKENDDSLTCEDERIRKAIHIYLDWLDGRKDYAPKGKYTIKDMIAWLEKRKDYVSPQMVADAYLRGCNDTEKKWLEKQGQAFPILSNSSKTVKDWTEEDEYHWIMCLECVEECATQKRKDFSKTISWLKQFKQRLE